MESISGSTKYPFIYANLYTFFPPELLLVTMMSRALFLLLGVFIFGSISGQNNRFRKHEIGLSVSIPFVYEKNSEGLYQPILIKGLLGWNLGRTGNIENKTGHFIWYLEPQINPVLVSGKLSELEFGCNFGFRFEKEIGEQDLLYWAIGTGPHFITQESRQQHPGYIFSDNFIFGWYHQLSGDYYSNLQYRFRHISNAGIYEPNLGIDNSFVGLGVSKLIR